MLTPRTDAALAAAMARLRADQQAGDAPAPGDISLAEIARRSGISEATLKRLESIALAKFRARFESLIRDSADDLDTLRSAYPRLFSR